MHLWTNDPSIIGNLQLFVAYEKRGICITVDCVHPIPALESNQEESYTRMLLLFQHISQSISNVVIHTPNTDVFIIEIAGSTELATSLFIWTGTTGTKGLTRIITMDKVKQSLYLQYDINKCFSFLIFMTVNRIAPVPWDIDFILTNKEG